MPRWLNITAVCWIKKGRIKKEILALGKKNDRPNKRTSKKGNPVAAKKTGQKEGPDSSFNRRIAWHFALMDSGGNWACNIENLNNHLDRLKSLETQTCNEIFAQQRKNAHNHPIPITRLEQPAQDRLEELGHKIEALHQINLGGLKRLWGVFIHNIFQILWIDMDHTVYIAKKK